MIFTAPENWPFGSALLVLLALAVLEGIGLLLAMSPSHLLEGLLPEAHGEMPDSALGWLHVGKVPLLVLLILFLTGFALSGFLLQALVSTLLGGLWPAWLASIPALFAGLATVRGFGTLLARIIPQDETSSISEQSLIGRPAVIMAGTARRDHAAQAKVRDAQGRLHYVMAEPDAEGETLAEGDSVLLVKKVGARFYVIRNPHPELLG